MATISTALGQDVRTGRSTRRSLRQRWASRRRGSPWWTTLPEDPRVAAEMRAITDARASGF